MGKQYRHLPFPENEHDEIEEQMAVVEITPAAADDVVTSDDESDSDDGL